MEPKMHINMAAGVCIFIIYWRMQLGALVMAGPVALSILHRHVTFAKINLTEEAEQYIRKINKRLAVTSWEYLSETSHFWKSREVPAGVHPVRGKTGELKFQSAIKDYERLGSYVKVINYVWTFTQALYCSFKISARIGLLVHSHGEFRKRNISVRVDNKLWLIQQTPPHIKIPKGPGIRKTEEHSFFTVDVSFDGFFAYQTVERAAHQKKYQYNAVNVTDLHKQSERLRLEHGNLTYLLKGYLTRRIFWQESAKSKMIFT